MSSHQTITPSANKTMADYFKKLEKEQVLQLTEKDRQMIQKLDDMVDLPSRSRSPGPSGKDSAKLTTDSDNDAPVKGDKPGSGAHFAEFPTIHMHKRKHKSPVDPGLHDALPYHFPDPMRGVDRDLSSFGGFSAFELLRLSRRSLRTPFPSKEFQEGKELFESLKTALAAPKPSRKSCQTIVENLENIFYGVEAKSIVQTKEDAITALLNATVHEVVQSVTGKVTFGFPGSDLAYHAIHFDPDTGSKIEAEIKDIIKDDTNVFDNLKQKLRKLAIEAVIRRIQKQLKQDILLHFGMDEKPDVSYDTEGAGDREAKGKGKAVEKNCGSECDFVEGEETIDYSDIAYSEPDHISAWDAQPAQRNIVPW